MKTWDNVVVEIDDGIAWVTLNRPDKRNAMNPRARRRDARGTRSARNRRARRRARADRRGRAFSAGMDLKEYFRATDGLPTLERAKRSAASTRCGNGDCSPTVFEADDRDGQRLVFRRRVHAADLVRSRDRGRRRGVRPLRDQLGDHPGRHRHQGGRAGDEPARCALLHHDRRDVRRRNGPRRWASSTMPCRKDQLRERTRKLARTLLEKNPVVLRAAKNAYKHVRDMSWESAADYLSCEDGSRRRSSTPANGRARG